ncbi:MAG: hypothetical protein P4M09_04665 [Devosia sp.]|nr:hypothetical protein [Devosia sp.]
MSWLPEWARDARFRLAALIILGLAILFLRRPDQFLHPYVWDEEGRWVLTQYIADGWRSVFYPLAGYMLFISRAILLTGFSVSILTAPAINAALMAAFTLGVFVAVAYSPTVLRWRALCAISMLLIPSDPEVFGVALYAFWWAGVLLVLAALWKQEGGLRWLRAIFIVLGGLSSPLIVPIAAILVLRAAWNRHSRASIAAAGLAIVMAGIQTYELYVQNAHPAFASLFSVAYYFVLIQKYVGAFFFECVRRTGAVCGRCISGRRQRGGALA